MSLEEFGVTRKIIKRDKDSYVVEDTYNLKHPNCPIVAVPALTHDAAYYVHRYGIPAKT